MHGGGTPAGDDQAEGTLSSEAAAAGGDQAGGTEEPIPVRLSPKPWSPSPQPPAWLNSAPSLPVSGPGRGRRAVRRGSHCPRCPHRELSYAGAAALTFLLQGKSWGRGDLALLLGTAAPEHLTAGQGGRPGAPNPLPAWPPAHLSTLGAAPSTALIPYRAFPCPPIPRSLFGNCAAPLHTEECTQPCLFRAGETCIPQSQITSNTC